MSHVLPIDQRKEPSFHHSISHPTCSFLFSFLFSSDRPFIPASLFAHRTQLLCLLSLLFLLPHFFSAHAPASITSLYLSLMTLSFTKTRTNIGASLCPCVPFVFLTLVLRISQHRTRSYAASVGLLPNPLSLTLFLPPPSAVDQKLHEGSQQKIESRIIHFTSRPPLFPLVPLLLFRSDNQMFQSTRLFGFCFAGQ